MSLRTNLSPNFFFQRIDFQTWKSVFKKWLHVFVKINRWSNRYSNHCIIINSELNKNGFRPDLNYFDNFYLVFWCHYHRYTMILSWMEFPVNFVRLLTLYLCTLLIWVFDQRKNFLEFPPSPI